MTAPRWLFAQAQPRIPRIALVLNGSPETHGGYYNAFRSGLHALGYSERINPNIILDVRWAEGQLGRLPALMAELLRSSPDAMVMAGSQALRAAKAATASVPVVMATVADPVEQGLVRSLERPGGNITGISVKSSALMLKSLELMAEAVPNASPVGVLVNPDNPFHEAAWKQTAAEAARKGLSLARFDAADLGQLERALAGIARRRPRTLVVGADALFNSFRHRLAQFTEKHRLPGVQSFRGYVEAGGFMSYSPDIANNHRLAASYVDRILKGEEPRNMAVMQSETYDLAINARFLRLLGIRLPPSLIERVDEFVD